MLKSDLTLSYLTLSRPNKKKLVGWWPNYFEKKMTRSWAGNKCLLQVSLIFNKKGPQRCQFFTN